MSVNYNGLVSIIIPTYNRFDMLLHCIKSCIKQTYQNIEIIVVNDCSTDPRYYEGRLETFSNTQVVHLPENLRKKHNVQSAQGLVRNAGVEKASGEWVAFLDDDDFFVPQKLEVQLRRMEQAQAMFGCCNMVKLRHTGPAEELKLHTEFDGDYFVGKPIPEIIHKCDILHDNIVCNSTVVIHKNVIDAVGPISLTDFEDWDYWKRALDHCYALYVNESLVWYSINTEKNYVYVTPPP